jgi:hypothetical protein
MPKQEVDNPHLLFCRDSSDPVFNRDSLGYLLRHARSFTLWLWLAPFCIFWPPFAAKG